MRTFVSDIKYGDNHLAYAVPMISKTHYNYHATIIQDNRISASDWIWVRITVSLFGIWYVKIEPIIPVVKWYQRKSYDQLFGIFPSSGALLFFHC